MEIRNNGNVYEQIVAYYRKYISLGVLVENEKMPSCRELAIKISVNHKTVEKAYQELVKEGLIYNVPKKGFFVSGKKENDNKMVMDVIFNLRIQGVKEKEILDAVAKIYGEAGDD